MTAKEKLNSSAGPLAEAMHKVFSEAVDELALPIKAKTPQNDVLDTERQLGELNARMG